MDMTCKNYFLFLFECKLVCIIVCALEKGWVSFNINELFSTNYLKNSKPVITQCSNVTSNFLPIFIRCLVTLA